MLVNNGGFHLLPVHKLAKIQELMIFDLLGA